MKALASLLFVALIHFNSSAQTNPHAIGLRGGLGNFGTLGEISYQRGISQSNRLELDLGWTRHGSHGHSHIYLAGIYQWVWNLSDGLNWYAGAGAILGLYSDHTDSNNDGFTISAAGQIGLEYDFNTHGVPLLLSVDMRPTWRFIGYSGHGNTGYGGAFAIRYTF